MTRPRSPLIAGPHRRYNPLLDEWVLVSPHRLERPWQGQVEKPQPSALPAYDPGCYLCPGNARANGERNPAYTTTFAFDNDFPALLPGAHAPAPAGDDLFVAEPQSGRCRVVCFSPRHDLTLAQMDTAGIRSVVDTWTEEVERLARVDGIRYVQVFENKGAAMGCSNPASPRPDLGVGDGAACARAQARDAAALRRSVTVATCWATTWRANWQMGDRVVCRNEAWVVVVPFWAVWPFETMVIPVRMVDDLRALTDDERDAACRHPPAADRALRQPVPMLVPVLDGLARAARRRSGASRAAGCTPCTFRRCCVRPRCASSWSGTK